jgi:predicted CoA-binding protein
VNPSDEEIRQLLTTSRTIAMVGASAKPDRPSHGIMKILMRAGYNVIPVTVRDAEVLGKRAYKSLGDIPERVDIVDVFRRAEDTPAIAEEAREIGARALWLQLGISNEEAARIATEAGMMIVMDKCIGVTVAQMKIHVGGGA